MAPAKGLTAQTVGDDLLLHDPEARRVCFLNRTARTVWEMAKAGAQTDAIVQVICESYANVDEQTARADIAACLQELNRLGLRAG
jgi:hypothetical protein